MQVSKWGNSLAIRLPAAVVEVLELKEGDEIEISVAGKRDLTIERDSRKEAALERLRERAKPLPLGWKFGREEANAR